MYWKMKDYTFFSVNKKGSGAQFDKKKKLSNWYFKTYFNVPLKKLNSVIDCTLSATSMVITIKDYWACYYNSKVR